MIKKIKRIVRFKRDVLKGKKYGGIRHFLIVAANNLIEEELKN